MDLNSSRKVLNEDSAPTLAKTDTSDEGKEKAKDLVMMKTFPKHGLPLEPKIEQMERRRYVLIRKYNWLTSAVREREDRLTNLLKLINCQPGNEGRNKTDKNYQHIVQMENDQEKVKMKIKEAKEIQSFYHLIWEHLKLEPSVLENLYEQKKHEFVIGQKAIEEAKKKHGWAQFDASTAEGQRVYKEHMVLEKRRNMDDELQELNAEKESLKILFGTSERAKLKKLENKEKALIAKTPEGSEVQHDRLGFDFNLLDDLNCLGEVLDFAEVQGKTVSEEDVGKAEIMAKLDIHCSKLEDSEKPAVRRFGLKEDTMSEMSQEVNRVQQQQPDVEKPQDLLKNVEQVIDNISLLLNCGPEEGLSRLSSLDKLTVIRTHLQHLLERKESDTHTQGRKKFFGIMKEIVVPNNNSIQETLTCPAELSVDKKECGLTREEIKCSSMKLAEALQKNVSKKRGRRSWF